MKFFLIAIGRTGDQAIKSCIDNYLSRLKHYAQVETLVIADVKDTRNMSHEQQKTAEGERILRAIESGDRVVLLDERGLQPTSTELAALLQKRMASGLRRLVFVIGGPYGFSPAVYNRADAQLSLSRLTFNHEMVRLIFAEQLYRAFTILNHEPYHHE